MCYTWIACCCSSTNILPVIFLCIWLLGVWTGFAVSAAAGYADCTWPENLQTLLLAVASDKAALVYDRPSPAENRKCQHRPSASAISTGAWWNGQCLLLLQCSGLLADLRSSVFGVCMLLASEKSSVKLCFIHAWFLLVELFFFLQTQGGTTGTGQSPSGSVGGGAQAAASTAEFQVRHWHASCWIEVCATWYKHASLSFLCMLRAKSCTFPCFLSEYMVCLVWPCRRP